MVQLNCYCTGSGMAVISGMVFCLIYQGHSDYIALNDRILKSW
jgi:hypothetical protein